MSKKTIKDIAAELVNKHSLSPIQADNFVDEMFKLVSDTLPSDKIVKVKGLGTFKIIEVQDRESVNVNTGERVVIEGHGKVSFTPDNSMKDLVNKPFSQFETVIVNDNVDFAEIDNKEEDAAILAEINNYNESPESEYTSESEPEKTSEQKLTIELESVTESESIKESSSESVIEPNQIIEPESANKNKQETEVRSEQIKHSESYSKSEIEPLQETEQKSSSQPKQIVDSKSVNKSESVTEPKLVKEKLEEIDSENISEKEISIDSQDVDLQEHSNHLFLKVVFSIFAALIIFGVGFCIGQYMSEKGIYNVMEYTNIFGKAEKPIVKPIDKSAYRSPVKHIGKQISKSDVQSKVKSDLKPTIGADNEVKAKSESTEVKDNESQSIIYDNKNAQVRTGAYRIIGVDNIITLKSDESVKSLSDRMLGPGMECYISVINDINESETLNKGQKIKIPKLELRHHKKH